MVLFSRGIHALVFYEVFVDDKKIRKLSKNFKKGVAVWVVAILLTFAAIFFLKNSLFRSVFIFGYICPILDSAHYICDLEETSAY